MASQRRVEWLPVVMGMLRLKTLDAFIDAHALPVDLSLGLVFTVVQYGEAALQPLKDGLASDDCTVRANAAACLGVLLSDRDLPQLRKTAQGDSCEKARSSSWVALGLMNDPRLSRMAEQRLNSQPAPGIEEKHALATALSATFSRSARDSLELLAGDGDQGLAQAAKNAMKDLEENLALASKRTPTPRAVLGDLAEVARRELRRTPSTFRFEGFEGKSAELSLGLGPADLEPVLRARTEVLRRLSDECLYEFRQLTYVARNLRLAANLPPRDLK
jgi:hypothetical protein